MPILLFLAWLTFFGVMGVISAATTREPAQIGPFQRAAVEVVAALMWTALSLVIAAFHRRVRRAAPGFWTLIAAHLPLFALSCLIDAAITRASVIAVSPGPRPVVPLLTMVVYYLDFDVVAYAITVAVTEIVLLRRLLAERQRHADRLESSLSRARLDYLEAQLQPHFLFNSLGAVSELAYDAPATAARVLHQLASIFRSALGRRGDEITLGEELVGIEPYLDIQRIRFADWLTIEYHIADSAVDCLVPRFVLQPLVENAIRHGLSGRHAAGVIEISAQVDGGSLVVRVTDNGVGLDAARQSAGRGIGLSNVRDRLRILYGGDDCLALTSNQSGGAVAELRIPARRRETPRSNAVVSPGDTRGADVTVGVSLPRVLRNPVVAIVLCWTLCGILWTQQSFLFLMLRGRLNGASWLSLARSDMLSAALWALLTPVTLAVARRFPLRRKGWPSRAALMFALCASGTLLHTVAWQRLASPGTPLVSQTYVLPTFIGFLIMCVLVAIGHRTLLLDWVRARERRSASLEAELFVARERAEKLQAIPPILLQSLDSIAGTARRDPALTERQLTRLADYVRLALECSDERGITPERQHALDAALDELRRTGAYSLSLTA
jgi:sensor histidine kinase YesM